MTQKCVLCESETRIMKDTQMADYHYCPHCEFISKDEQHLLSEQEELRIYSHHNNSIEDPRYVRFFYKFLDDAVFPYVNTEKNGFDFGSGPSPVLAQILERNHDYQMDIYDLFYASEKVYIGKQYDLVTSTEVVEHLKNPLDYFKLFAALLKPTGILAVMTLFHHNCETHFSNWHYTRDLSHISFFTAETMEYIAAEVGLKVIHTNNIRYTTFVLDH